MTAGLLWPVKGHTTISQNFGKTTVQTEQKSYEHRGWLRSDAGGAETFRIYGQGTLAGAALQGLVHPALDVPCPIGTPILAPADGIIVAHAIDTLSGEWYLTEKINSQYGTEIFFTHLSKFVVPVGAHVKQGQEIALSGNTGWGSGPHCHWEVRTGAATNPEIALIDLRWNPLRCVQGHDLAGSSWLVPKL